MKSILLILCGAVPLFAQKVTLENGDAVMSWELNGGSLVDFHLKPGALNPFTWELKSGAETLRGHFVCLDRWGAPSKAELAAGMPYHGEAPRRLWRKLGQSAQELQMAIQLKMARLAVRRDIKLEGGSALVIETMTNENPLGRPYNIVQHPTIGPPFLDESAVVDSNARQGFMQTSPMPNPENPTVVWPQALKDGMPVDIRHLHNDPVPNVVSYVIDEEWGWTTAMNAAKGLLVGYVWRTREYPWLNMWRDVLNGKPQARGLEFGTTGLHQPFPVLLQKGRIFGRLLYTYLDSGETQDKRYQIFLLQVPNNLQGIDRMEAQGNDFIFTGRDGKEYRVRSLF